MCSFGSCGISFFYFFVVRWEGNGTTIFVVGWVGMGMEPYFLSWDGMECRTTFFVVGWDGNGTKQILSHAKPVRDCLTPCSAQSIIDSSIDRQLDAYQ
jgi:hypothetical protein